MDNKNTAQINIENIDYYFTNIEISIKDFNSAFGRNNFYGLINLSEVFYENSIAFIQHTNSLLKKNELNLSLHETKGITDKIQKVDSYVFQLKNHRNYWLLRKNFLITQPGFSDIYHQGNEKLNLLAQEMSDLSRLDIIKNEPKNRRRCT